MGRNHRRKEAPEGMGKCIFTAIFYPLIMLAVGAYMYYNGSVSIESLAGCAICCAIAALCVFGGGFYLIIIPLPFISVDLFGSVRDVNLAVKFLLVVLIIAAGFGAIVSLVGLPTA